MSVINTIKTAAESALGLIKANPVAAAGIAVGSVVVGYGGYRGVKYLRNRPSSKAVAVAPAAVAAPVTAEAPAVAPAPVVAPEAATQALLSMSREQAVEIGMLTEWNTALKAALRDKQKK